MTTVSYEDDDNNYDNDEHDPLDGYDHHDDYGHDDNKRWTTDDYGPWMTRVDDANRLWASWAMMMMDDGQ